MSAMTAPPATVAFSEPSVTVRASEKESAVAGRSEGREPGPSVGSQLAEKLSGADQAMNVLVVEDDKSTRVIVESLLVSCGHSGASTKAADFGYYCVHESEPLCNRKEFCFNVWLRVFGVWLPQEEVPSSRARHYRLGTSHACYNTRHGCSL